MPPERNKATPAVYLILKKNDEILLMRRQGSPYYSGWYSLPAGHVEAGELPIRTYYPKPFEISPTEAL